MQNYDSLALSLAKQGHFAQCHINALGIFTVTLFSSKTLGGAQHPHGSGTTSLEALMDADEWRRNPPKRGDEK